MQLTGPGLGGCKPLRRATAPVDGGQFAERSGGSGKGDIFFNAKWQFIANGLYELPGGFEAVQVGVAEQ